jgi:hypothetical protein
MGKGVPKKLTAKERRRRAASLAEARKKRWPVKQNCMVSLPAERIGFADSPPARGRKRGQETEGRRE